ncbi:HRSL1 enzyme, partial [Pitta sordida]|nr:HRSL1 enzyme [Pitta sordida]
PMPGDLIEIQRRGYYQHWVLYLGDGYVIHVTAADEDASPASASTVAVCARKAMVRKQLLKVVVGNDYWHVNNKYDSSRKPFAVEEIIRRAERWINREWEYGLVKHNCEHFVTMLRYGEGVSDQVS